MIVIKIILGILAAAVAFILLYFFILAIAEIFVNDKKDYEKDSPFFRFMLNFGIAVTLRLLRIRLKVSGEENLPAVPFLLVGNHCSNWDPIVTLAALRKHPLAFISKPENLKIPLVGRMVRRCCFMSIDRENPRVAMKTIFAAAKLLRESTLSIGVYPEGTRSKTGTLLPFHNGVFKIAQKAKAPIAIVGVKNTQAVAKRFPWRSTTIEIAVLNLLPAEAVAAARTEEIAEQVRAELEKFL